MTILPKVPQLTEEAPSPSGGVELVLAPSSAIQYGSESLETAVTQFHECLNSRGPLGLPNLSRVAFESKEWKYTAENGEPAYSREFPMLILADFQVLRYHDTPYGQGTASAPACFSNNQVFGLGNPGGDCRICEMAKRPEGKARQCRECRLLFGIMKETGMLVEVNLPPTSIGPFRQYERIMNSARVPLWLQVSIVRCDGSGRYPRATFRRGQKLGPEEAQFARALRNELIGTLERIKRESMQDAGNEAR